MTKIGLLELGEDFNDFFLGEYYTALILTSESSSPSHCVPCIIRRRPQPQVFRITTCTVVTSVQHTQVARLLAGSQEVGHAM